MPSNSKEIRRVMNSPNTLAPHRLLKNARSLMGVSRHLLANRMGISHETLEAYEKGTQRIPNSILLKLYMFGIDFWIDGAVLTD